MKKKPLGRTVDLPESRSAEGATPDEQDILRADGLAQVDPVLDAMWNAEPYESESDAD